MPSPAAPLSARLAAHLSSLSSLSARLAPRGETDRGDVPGWVLVTVMSAGIVVAIAGVAAPTLQQMFEQAISAVQVP